MSDLQLCATGVRLFRQAVRAIGPAMNEMLSGTKAELQIATYLLLDAGGDLLEAIESVVSRGIKTMIVVNRLEDHPLIIREWAVRMNRSYLHFEARSYGGDAPGQLHAKVVVCDRSHAILGSANLTTSAMNRNVEIGALVAGDTAWALASLVDEIAKVAHPFGVG